MQISHVPCHLEAGYQFRITRLSTCLRQSNAMPFVRGLKSRPDLGELNTNFLLARDVILENLNRARLFSVGFAACEAILRHTGFQLPLNLDLHQTHRTDAMLPALSRLPQQVRQLGDVGRDPPRLIAREQLGTMSALPPKAAPLFHEWVSLLRLAVTSMRADRPSD
jgi:hypothetical protein